MPTLESALQNDTTVDSNDLRYDRATDGAKTLRTRIAEVASTADSAVQPGDNISSLTNDSGYLTSVIAAGVSYDNASSGLAATDVQAAIDELDGAIDAMDVTPEPPAGGTVYGRRNAPDGWDPVLTTATYDPQGIGGDAFARANHTGTIGVGDIDASGTASGSTYLRGDGAWATPDGSGSATIASPLDFGAVADGSTDDQAAIQACIDDVTSTVSGDGFRVIDGGGRTYAVSSPIEIGANGLLFQNAKLIALPSASWTVNNAVLQATSGYNVLASNLYIDANDNAYNCWLHTQEGFVRVEDVRVEGFINNGFDFRASIVARGCLSRKFPASDTRLNDPAQRTGRGFSLTVNATDSQLTDCRSSYVQYPFYVGRDQHHITFIGCHPFNSQPNGSPWVDSYGIFIDGGYEIGIIGCYIDLGMIYYKIYDDGFSTVYMTVASNNCLGSSAATFDAWIVLETAIANTNLDQFFCYGNKWRTNEPHISLQTSGSGSWDLDEATVESALKNASFLGPRAEFIGTEGAVAGIVRNAGDPNFCLWRFRNPASSTNQAVEIGSSQDEFIARVNGAVRLSANDVGLVLQKYFSTDLDGESPNITAPEGTLVYVPNGPGGQSIAVSNGTAWEYAGGSGLTSNPGGVTGADAVTNIISLTQAEYDALGSTDPSTLYVITDAGEVTNVVSLTQAEYDAIGSPDSATLYVITG